MFEMDDYVVETLMRDLVGHDRRPTAYLVYLYLWYRSERGGGGSVSLSLRELADGTGASRRAVQDSVSRLHQRKLIGVRRESITAVPEYTVHRPWRR